MKDHLKTTANPPDQGWPDAPESVAGSNRNGWPDVVGISGRVRPECASESVCTFHLALVECAASFSTRRRRIPMAHLVGYRERGEQVSWDRFWFLPCVIWNGAPLIHCAAAGSCLYRKARVPRHAIAAHSFLKLPASISIATLIAA